ncbi:uncharacterized protein LOC124533794 isoform X2 [Vanessa cardui]|uniref:uncharacterized protein LOC124533794 isoform X2 n=1 Tax=Vanessa cardui TaxID=171605 RepID=UPI001F14170B|nr:uncharacterized protein LOC124533794 isoform X2 [Vanessa cardui]
MALSDSMFLFELGIKDLKCYTTEKELKVVAQFAEIFKTTIKNPINASLPMKKRKVIVQSKQKVRKNNATIKKSLNLKPQLGQSILIVNKLPILVSYMKHFPLELSLWKDINPNVKLGSVVIPWNKIYTEYLSDVENNPTILAPCSQGVYSIYHDISSKRVVTINLSIKITYLGNKITSHFRSISKNVPLLIYTQNNSNTNMILSTVNNIVTKENDQNNPNSKHVTNIKPGNEIIEKILSLANTKKISDINMSIKPLHDTVYNLNTVKSKSVIIDEKQKVIDKSRSCLSISSKRNNTLKYIFGDPSSTFGNKVYCVGYFSVKNDSSPQNSPKESDVENVDGPSILKKIKYKKCASDCRGRERLGSSSTSANSLNLSDEGPKIRITKCKDVNCNDRVHRKLPPSGTDGRINLDMSNLKKECCNENKTVEKVEEVIGGVTAKMKYGDDPCFCTCECTFGFTKKTTYCDVCGGYELAGDEISKKPFHEMPIPCPIFHNLVDKSKLKTWSTSGSEGKKKGDDQKNLKTSSPLQKAAASDKPQTVTEKKSVESEKDSKKGKKKKKDDRFKFNYGYKAPQIGHSKCGLPCTGTLDNVPKNMGWLWTSEDVPGMKFRPMWKPGATNKHVVRLLKIAKNPGQVISKKKRKDTNKRKRPLKRPLLIVHKKDGEFTITMETMKSYLKPRTLNQQPYEDKPVLTYTIGRTDEENRIRLKKKERARRRLERAQREFIQSTFRDMCQEICLKTYQQALGILPDTEDPKCLCYPAVPTEKTTNMNLSCSCSEDESSIGSDTDSDEWIVEFTPPNAIFDPSYKGKKIIKVDNGSQYTYLDYRVKLVDRFGNIVPRFFKGPDGKEQCSDLGGFWSPDHKWLEINVDGYIAPDGRWAPNTFIGPNGEQVDAETGKFQAMNGKWLIVGVDGYIDINGKWKFYPASAGSMNRTKHRGDQTKKRKTGDKKYDKSETSWSCFGDVSPRQLSKLGIVGHGGDRKLLISTLQDMLAHGEDVNIPQPKTVFHLPPSKKTKFGQKEINKMKVGSLREKMLNGKCHHPVPSDKGIVAVDEYGNKTYFKLRHRKNYRPRERLAALEDRGISLSSFHVPCFNSFINSEVMKQQLRDRLLAQATKTTATQI